GAGLESHRRDPVAACRPVRPGCRLHRQDHRPVPQGSRSRRGGDPLTMEAVRVAIAGAGGRMGHALIEAVLATPDLALTAALDIAGSPMLGRDAGEHCGRSTGVTVGSDVDAALAHADVLVDFTRPEGTLAHLAAC